MIIGDIPVASEIPPGLISTSKRSLLLSGVFVDPFSPYQPFEQGFSIRWTSDVIHEVTQNTSTDLKYHKLF